MKQPEANADLFYLVEETLLQIDTAENNVVANIPLYFTLQLGSLSGFAIHGNFSAENNILDLQEGYFTKQYPSHNHYAENENAQIISQLLFINNINTLKNISLNKNQRRQILQHLQTYMALHVSGFGQLRSLSILQEIIA